MEKNNFFYRLLSNPYIYYFSQFIMSATLFRKNVIKKYVKEQTNIKILDIGCGPADVLENFQKINYYGFDTNQEYINHAKKKIQK